MFKPLLSPPADRQRFLRLLGTAAGFALALAAPAAVQAQTVYGLGTVTGPATGQPVGSQLIGNLNVATGTINILATVAVTGVTTGQTLVGMDSRPATGELFALGYDATTTSSNAQLYTLNPTSGVATPVGNVFRLELGDANDRIGFDFNPTVDLIRVVGSYNPTTGNTNNYRLNPTPGTGGAITVIRDVALAYASSTPADPNIGAAAYTNSAFGASTTVLYDIDETNGLLAQQNPPNNGTLATQVPITLNGAGFGAPKAIDVDVYVNPTTGAQSAYLIEVTAGGSSNFYNFNLATGAATSVGAANVVPAVVQVEVRDIAAAIAPRVVPALQGQLAYAVTTNNNLISFDTQNPSVIRSLVAITGLPTTQTLVGTDFRPNTGQLFGLGYDPAAGANDRLYTIDLATGVATPVGPANIDLALGTDLTAIGFDFNPTVDRIRVVSANDANYRLNPNNGAVAFTDGTLAYAPGDPNVNQDPNVGTGAYTNSFVGSSATGLYVLDHVSGTVSFQNPPNAGTLTVSRQLVGVNGAGVGGAIGAANDLDVYFDGTANKPYLAAVPGGAVNSRFYSLDALGITPNPNADQTATDLGPIGGATTVRDISIVLAPNSTPTTAAAITGRLLYAVAGGNLISFDSGNPGVIRTAVNITGLPADGSQVLAGADFRPLNGTLYALGYNAATSQGQLYSMNITTGALTAIGPFNSLTLGAASGIGFDFNPLADRIRIVGANGNNYRLNPADGLLATPSDGATGRALSGTAYTNNDNNANTGTTQYGYDQTTNEVVVFSNPNAGTNATLGSSTITVNTANGVEFDIYSDLTNPAAPVNTAFAVAATGTSTADGLYSVSLTTGAFTSLGQIGNGSNLSGLAAFLTPGPVIAAGITWTGAVSTDWGTAGNWSPAQVPTATDNVTIPDTPNDPVVSDPRQVNSLTLGSGATLTTANQSLLTLNGNFLNNGGTVLGAGTGEVRFAGATPQTIGGTATQFQNLTASTPGGLTLNAPTSVQRLLALEAGTLTTNANLTLLSNANGTAEVVNNGSSTSSGTVTVQRYIDPTRNTGLGYRHYSSPVGGSTVADLATPGFTPVVNPAYNTQGNSVVPFPTVFGYEESRVMTSGNPAPQDFDMGFFSPNALNDPLLVTRGYTVNIASSEKVDFVGALNNGTYNTGNLTRGAQAQSGFHLRGNPYPSAISWDNVVRNNVDATVYVYRSSGQYAGTYSTYTVNGAATNGGQAEIPVAQGFFVRANSNTADLTFNNTARITAYTNPVFQRGALTAPLVRLDLRNAAGLADEAVVFFDAAATAAFDSEFDAFKLLGGSPLAVASTVGTGTMLAVNGLPALTSTDVTVPLRVQATVGANTLKATELLRLPAGTRAYLQDALTGTSFDLSQPGGYSFTVAAGATATGRFSLLITSQRVLAAAPAALAQLASVYPNPAHGTATLLLPAALRGQQATAVTVVDNVGRVVLSRTMTAGATEALELPLAGLAPGVYSVLARTSAGIVAKRLVIE